MVLQLLRRVRQEQEAIGARPKPQEAVPAAAKGTARMTENSRIGMAMPERDPGDQLAASLAEERGVLGRKVAVCDHPRQAPLAPAQGQSSRRVATPNDSSILVCCPQSTAGCYYVLVVPTRDTACGIADPCVNLPMYVIHIRE